MKFKFCIRCGDWFWAKAKQNRCDPCRVAYLSDPEQVRKHTAVRLVALAIRAGALRRQPCEKCGRERTHAHHDDYSKPLAVRWLCPMHHKWEHAEGRS